MRLLLLRRDRDLYAAAPEFRYLASWLAAEARAAFAEVEIARDEAAALTRPTAGAADAVLVVEDDVLLTRATLAALRSELEAGARWAAPAPLTAARDRFVAGAPVYTLRGFERLEGRAIAAGAVSGGAPRPVSLWRRSALAEAAARAGGLATTLDRAREDEGRTAGLFHQFIPYYGERRDDVLPLLPERLGEVLEIGCGDGTTGELLERRYGCRVTGVELNPVAARAAAKRIHRVLAADVESLELEGRFDLVLALELFEHLTDQESFLRRMRRLLEPDGTLLLSVPNVGHGAIVEDLIAGRFDYLPIGLLCYTHYRFFTRETLERWLERCGFGRVRCVAQKTEPPEKLLASLAGSALEVDAESLATRGFYVLAQP